MTKVTIITVVPVVTARGVDIRTRRTVLAGCCALLVGILTNRAFFTLRYKCVHLSFPPKDVGSVSSDQSPAPVGIVCGVLVRAVGRWLLTVESAVLQRG